MMKAGTTSGDRFRSWPEILTNAARAAGGLRALGVAEDDSLALMLRNDFATFEVNMAAGQLGAQALLERHGLGRLVVVEAVSGHVDDETVSFLRAAALAWDTMLSHDEAFEQEFGS